jgi:hypothetical protein
MNRIADQISKSLSPITRTAYLANASQDDGGEEDTPHLLYHRDPTVRHILHKVLKSVHKVVFDISDRSFETAKHKHFAIVDSVKCDKD